MHFFYSFILSRILILVFNLNLIPILILYSHLTQTNMDIAQALRSLVTSKVKYSPQCPVFLEAARKKIYHHFKLFIMLFTKIYHRFKCTWSFSLSIYAHAQNIGTKEFLRRKSSENFYTEIVKK